jgi:hypothetical protein
MTEQNPEPTPETTSSPATIEAAQQEAAKRSREDYDKATAPTREAKGYVTRYAAYDDVRLAFVEGTVSTTASGAKDLAKDLGHEGDHISTRKV